MRESFAEGEFYHIYSRGNSKQNIFLDDHDRDRFVKLLYLCNSHNSIDFREDIVRKGIDAWQFERGEPIVDTGAWVLMSNHFHLYLTIHLRKSDFRKNGITEFMRKLLTSYSKYFNRKYNRTGSLFEGKFKSIHIEKDTQAKYLFSYIHLNPVKIIDSKWKENGLKNLAQAKKFLKNYKWSSYLDYKKIIRPENKILNLKPYPNYFKNIKDFEEDIMEWLSFDKDT